MIDSSKAYKKLKGQIQDSIDFVLLCCHATPALKGYMKAVESGSTPKIPDPDIFKKPTNHQRLREIIPNYRKVLGRYLIMSSFSYFEAYISDVFVEIFEFHGGRQEFLQRATSKRDETFNAIDQAQERIIMQLRETPKKGKQAKYKRSCEELNRTGYRFPTDLLAAYGILRLQEQLQNFRSVEVPGLVQSALGLTLSQTDIDGFHRIRELRNSIAHGETTGVDLNEAIEANRSLRTLAVKIDKHIVKHFLVVEI